MSMIKKGDKVIVTAGKDRGKSGKVIQILPAERKAVVEGVNVFKKHLRTRREGQKGQVIELPTPLADAKLQIFCERCQRGVRLGSRVEADKKVRYCKKCKEVI